jgi:hypothetical protein
LDPDFEEYYNEAVWENLEISNQQIIDGFFKENGETELEFDLRKEAEEEHGWIAQFCEQGAQFEHNKAARALELELKKKASSAWSKYKGVGNQNLTPRGSLAAKSRAKRESAPDVPSGRERVRPPDGPASLSSSPDLTAETSEGEIEPEFFDAEEEAPEGFPPPDESPSPKPGGVACDPPSRCTRRTETYEGHSKGGPRLVALDLHNTLDDGGRKSYIPSRHVEAVKELLKVGLIVWICSYIGRSIGGDAQAQWESQRKRNQAEERRVWLAKRCNLDPSRVDKPTKGFLFLCITDRKVFSQHHSWDTARQHLNGKGECLYAFDTQVLFDDNACVCREVEQYGVLAYQVTEHVRKDQPPKGKGKDYRSRREGDPIYNCGSFAGQKGLYSRWAIHLPQDTFPEAVRVFLTEFRDGNLDYKVKIIDRQRQWGRHRVISSGAFARQSKEDREERDE